MNNMIRSYKAETKTISLKAINYFKSLIDDRGIIQFSKKKDKDITSDYAIEDQARALILCLNLHDKNLAKFFSGLLLGSRASKGVFMLWDKDGQLLSKTDGFGEASAEVIWALGEYKKTGALGFEDFAEFLIRGVIKNHYVRAHAYALLGTVFIDKNLSEQLIEKLILTYKLHSSSKWSWFEGKMTYANALLPWSLIRAGNMFKNEQALDVGLSALNFLLESLVVNQIPIVVGNRGWWNKNGKMAVFDQQPIDVAYLVLACCEAYLFTEDKKYKEKAFFYYSWFWGNNMLHKKLITIDGRCGDGLGEKSISQNSGAESTISFLLAVFSTQKLETGKK